MTQDPQDERQRLIALYREMTEGELLKLASEQDELTDEAYQAYNETGSRDRSFTGKDEDTTTGLYRFPAREYSPTQGRWISADPAGRKASKLNDPQTQNRYAYVRNNPCRFTDPTGLYLYNGPARPGPIDITPDLAPTNAGPDRGSGPAFGGNGGNGFDDIAPEIGDGENIGDGGNLLIPWEDRRDFYRLGPVYDIAVAALQNKDCAALFGRDTVAGRNLTAAAALTAIVAGSDIGRIEFGAVPGHSQTLGNLGQLSTVLAFMGMDASSVTITFNNDPKYTAGEGWNGQTIKEDAADLLHELMHATWLLGFREQDPAFKQADGRSTAANEANQALINRKCFH